MKITEVLNIDSNNDLFDVIKLPSLPKIDEFMDRVIYITDNFNIPVDYLNKDMVDELYTDSVAIKNILDNVFDNNSRWVISINKIVNYFSNSVI